MAIPESVAAKLQGSSEYAPLTPVIGESFRGVLSAQEAAELLSQTGYSVQQLALWLSAIAAEYALPVISSYRVGAIAEGIRPSGAPIGALYFGANMEFAGEALSFTLHAEQSATVNAWQNGETGLTSLAVDEAPCGYCRQFLYETSTAQNKAGPGLTIYLDGQPPQNLTVLLPQAFGPSDLGIKNALMNPERHGLNLETRTDDPVVLAALAAANSSYAPYTSGFAGVAVETSAGMIYTGRYGENAAYNPSISPLESTLTMWNFAGDRTDAVTRCVLVEKVSASNQFDATTAVLESFAGLTPECWPAD